MIFSLLGQAGGINGFCHCGVDVHHILQIKDSGVKTYSHDKLVDDFARLRANDMRASDTTGCFIGDEFNKPFPPGGSSSTTGIQVGSLAVPQTAESPSVHQWQ